jgi:hypothetical protein
MSADPPTPALADYEGRVRQCQKEIVELREQAVQLDEFAKLSGAEALDWLIRQGCSDKEARRLIVAIILARRARLAAALTVTEAPE